MAKHAFLSASASNRWLNCPPSAKLCAKVPDQSSSYALEGTDCHELCAYLVEKALGRDVQDPTENLTFYNGEMKNCAEEYCEYVLQQLEEAKQYCPDPRVFIEQRLDFSRWVENGFGTGDCVILADQVLQIIDYKHGVGVLVNADHNTQMMCYSLGALEIFGDLYDVDRITMTIFQPRRDNISTWTISKADLLHWADTVLTPTAKLAYEGKGEYNLELAKYDFAMPDTLDDLEIASILGKVDQLVSWGNDIKAYALKKAQSGTQFIGWKVVEGRSNRKYTDEAAVAAAVQNAGYDPYEQKLLGITAMSTLLGKKQFDELLGELVYKPPGKPALVPESDKRPAVNTAADDFKENNMEENNYA